MGQRFKENLPISKQVIECCVSGIMPFQETVKADSTEAPVMDGNECFFA